MSIKQLITAFTLSAFTLTAMAAPQNAQPTKPETAQTVQK